MIEFQCLGILPVTPDWMWLSVPNNGTETFKIKHNYSYHPSAYALLTQGFSSDLLIASVKKIYPQGNPSLEFLKIPDDLKLIQTSRYIGVKIGYGRLIYPDWSIEIHQLVLPNT